jgi:hypothetical protein
VALRETAAAFAARPETMLAERSWKLLASDQDVERVLERLDVEFDVLADGPVIALEAREND